MAADQDVLQHGEGGEQADVLEGAGDAGGQDLVRRQAEQLAALEADGAAGGGHEAGDDVEEGGLAGAVGADDGDDAAVGDGDVDLLSATRPPKRTVTPRISRRLPVLRAARVRGHACEGGGVEAAAGDGGVLGCRR